MEVDKLINSVGAIYQNLSNYSGATRETEQREWRPKVDKLINPLPAIYQNLSNNMGTIIVLYPILSFHKELGPNHKELNPNHKELVMAMAVPMVASWISNRKKSFWSKVFQICW